MTTDPRSGQHATRSGKRHRPRRYRIDDLEEAPQTEHLSALLEGDGWQRTRNEDWDFFWSFQLHDESVFRSLRQGQLTNHFSGIGSIALKNTLHFYLAAAKRRMHRHDRGAAFDFFPSTYTMPQDYEALLRAATAEPKKNWVLKPTYLCTGRGIEMLQELPLAPRKPGWIVQEYVADPLLLPDHPHKHVIRPFLLITSLNPLVIYLHRNGIVRITPRPYTLSKHALADPAVHFFDGRGHPADPIRTIDLLTYRENLRVAGIDFEAIWEEIRRMMILTIMAHREPILAASLQRGEYLDGCYELLGCDVLVDSALKPWLLECNISPALRLSAPEGTSDRDAQERAKNSVVTDTLLLLGLVRSAGLHPHHPRGGGFERIYPAWDAEAFFPYLQIRRPADVAMLRKVKERGLPARQSGARDPFD